MNRKRLLVIILVFTLTFVGIISFLRFRSYYNRHVLSSGKWNNIISSRKEDNKLILSSLKFQDVSLLYDSENKTYYYSYVDSSKKFNPSISYQSSDSIKVAFSDKITQDKNEKNYDYQILIYTKDKYSIYHLVVTGLPILNFDFDVDSMTGNKKNSVAMTLYDNHSNAFHKIVHSSCDIIVTSNETSKKDFTFSLIQDSLGHNERENNISILGMMQHSEYVLNSMSDDPDLIRNIFTTNLWNDTYNPTPEKYQYVEVFLNHQYYGLYTLGYNVERESLRLGPGEFLFFKKEFIDSEENYNSSDNLGGYVLYDQNIEKVPRGKNNNDLNDAWTELKSSYKDIYSNNISSIQKYTQNKNTMDIYLFYLFSQATDHVNFDTFANTYLIFRRNANGYGLEYLPWNLNYTFGNDMNEILVSPTDNSVIMEDNPVARLIELNDIETIKKVQEEFTSLRKNVWSNDNLLQSINRYEDSLYNTGAYIRNSNKWDENPSSNDSKLAVFKTYVKDRIESLEYYINNLK